MSIAAPSSTCPTGVETDRLLGAMIEKASRRSPAARRPVEVDVPTGLAVFALPAVQRQRLRTTNVLKRLNEEVRRRTGVAPLPQRGRTAETRLRRPHRNQRRPENRLNSSRTGSRLSRLLQQTELLQNEGCWIIRSRRRGSSPARSGSGRSPLHFPCFLPPAGLAPGGIQ